MPTPFLITTSHVLSILLYKKIHQEHEIYNQTSRIAHFIEKQKILKNF